MIVRSVDLLALMKTKLVASRRRGEKFEVKNKPR